MELGWGIWNFVFAVFVLSAGATFMHQNKNFRSLGWFGGLVLILLSVWTMFYILQFAFGTNLVPKDVPLQFTDISEGIGKYFLNIGTWITQQVGA